MFGHARCVEIKAIQEQKNTSAYIVVTEMELNLMETQEELHLICNICQNEACKTGSSYVLKEQKVKACIKEAKRKGVEVNEP